MNWNLRLNALPLSTASFPRGYRFCEGCSAERGREIFLREIVHTLYDLKQPILKEILILQKVFDNVSDE